MSGTHHFVVTSTLPDGIAGPPNVEDLQWHIECVTPNQCTGWIECHEDHECDCHDEDSIHDVEEHEFHGQLHTHEGYYGWCLPYSGCVVAETAMEGTDAYEMAREHGIGTYLVSDDWYDADELNLQFVEEVAA